MLSPKISVTLHLEKESRMQVWRAVTDEAVLDCSYSVDGWAEQTPNPGCLTLGLSLAGHGFGSAPWLVPWSEAESS